jgi:hypothetical protein
MDALFNSYDIVPICIRLHLKIIAELM